MYKLAVLGYPIEHSLSPVMHEAAYRAMDLPATYEKIAVKPELLEDTLSRLLTSGYHGVNLTIPLKETVLPFLDAMDPAAKRIGAVNTILFEHGELHGYNTDGRGWLASFHEEMGQTITDKDVLVLGAGGAARAILDALCDANVKSITLYNRTQERAQALASSVRQNHENVQLDVIENVNDLQPFGLIINTTSVGLAEKNMTAMPISLSTISSKTIVSDIVYRPLYTPFLMAAKEAGCPIHTGIGMLLHQGALAIRTWFSMEPPRSVMRKALLQQLGEQSEE